MSARQHRLYHRLQVAAHRAQKAADRAVLEAAGITTAQAAVLAVVAAGGRVSQRRVARELGLNESAVTAMVARLMKMRLIVRSRDGDDGRVWRLGLSRPGRTALTRASRAFAAINAVFESALDEAETARLADALGRVGKAFGRK